MKFKTHILILLLLSLAGQAQVNLVPNGSFETYTTCPNSPAQLAYTGNWFFAGASTDYYNACSPQGNMSVPSNIYGFQPADSSAYVGMNVYALTDFDNSSNYREPASTAMVQQLALGQKYYVSFKVALTVNNFESCCAINKLGALFSTIPYSNSNPAPVKNFAQVFSDSVIIDTLNWTMISGSFVADSAYSYLSIGNFFDSSHIKVIDFNNNYPLTSGAYYYVDDVRVSTDSNFVMAKQTFTVQEGVTIFPNPTNGSIKLIGNRIISFKIFNKVGELVLAETCFSGATIDLSSFPSGSYFLEIKKEKEIVYKKIILNK